MSTEGAQPLPGFLNRLKGVDRHIQRCEVVLCVAALGLMILLAFGQVFLRQFRGVDLLLFTVPHPVSWFDNVARHLVIWVGVLGGSLATAEGRHISIEALPKILERQTGPRKRIQQLCLMVSIEAAKMIQHFAGTADKFDPHIPAVGVDYRATPVEYVDLNGERSTRHKIGRDSETCTAR